MLSALFADRVGTLTDLDFDSDFHKPVGWATRPSMPTILVKPKTATKFRNWHNLNDK